MDALHPARAALKMEMNEILRKLAEVEQIISPPRHKPAFSAAFAGPVEQPARPAVEPEARAEPAEVRQKVAARSFEAAGARAAESAPIYSHATGYAHSPGFIAQTPARRLDAFLLRLTAPLRAGWRLAGQLAGRAIATVATFMAMILNAILGALYFLGSLPVRAVRALFGGLGRMLAAVRHALAAMARGVSRLAHSVAQGVRRMAGDSASAIAAIIAGIAAPVLRALAFAGGATCRAGGSLMRGIGRMAPALELRTRRLADAGARHAASFAGQGRQALHRAASRTSIAVQRAADVTGRTVNRVRRRASANLKELTTDILFGLIVLISHVAPIIARLVTFAWRALRSAGACVFGLIGQAASATASGVRALPDKIRRLARAIAKNWTEHAEPSLDRTARQAKAAFWAGAFHACVWVLLSAGHVAAWTRAAIARARPLIGRGSNWLQRQGVSALAFARHRMAPAVRSGLTRASGAAKFAWTGIRARSSSLARKLELARRVRIVSFRLQHLFARVLARLRRRSEPRLITHADLR